MSSSLHKFGRWPSALSAGFVAGKALRFQTLQALEGQLVWSEMHPEQQGRATLMMASPGEPPAELLPAPFSAHSKVHEYGGAAFLATPQTLFFVNGKDQQIWQLDMPSGADTAPEVTDTPRQITHAADWRFADLVLDAPRQRLICIAEHHNPSHRLPENLLVGIPLNGDRSGKVEPLMQADDFYASPRLSPDGQQLAFLSWNLPHMPWEKARLHLAQLDRQGKISQITSPAAPLNGASFQPEWDKKGRLWFINDHSGFGQLYRFDEKAEKKLTHYHLDGAECGAPLWNLGMKTYGFLDEERIALIALHKGRARLHLIDPDAPHGPHQPLKQENLCALEQLVTLPNRIAGLLSRADQPQAIASLPLKGGFPEILRSSADFALPRQELSMAQTLAFENRLGQKVYAHYYPPTNPACSPPADERPPVILTAHGGPTAHADCGLKLKTQFWTSRGFGYFDINYSGSWGFGKAFRQRLDGQWGIADVQDMAAAAHHLIDAGLADPARLLISGSSAGGYSVLMALVKLDLFAAGASYYGISDLARLNDSTHKFEAGYIAKLLGLDALSEKEQKALLRARSPLFQADKITAPMIFFQGLEDRVVPPEQAEKMVRALKKQGVPTRYQSFANEGHGFRNSATIKTALTMEYEFYLDVLAL